MPSSTKEATTGIGLDELIQEPTFGQNELKKSQEQNMEVILFKEWTEGENSANETEGRTGREVTTETNEHVHGRLQEERATSQFRNGDF